MLFSLYHDSLALLVMSSSIFLAYWLTCHLHEDLQTTLKWLPLPHSSNFFMYARHYQGVCPVPQYVHLLLCEVSHVYFLVFCWMASNSLVSFMLYNTMFWVLCISNLCPQVKTHSLVASSIFSNVDTFLNISLVMPSLLAHL